MADSAYCIFYWDHNGSPNEVELDSVWTSEKDALARMRVITDFEDGYLQYKLLERTEPVDAETEVRTKMTLTMESADGAVIRWEYPDSTFNPTRGYFCREVRCNDPWLLRPVEKELK